MELSDIYNLIEAHLDNEIFSPQDKMGKLKRVKLPVPKEYGGGVVTGYGYEDTIRNLVDRIRDQIKMESKAPSFKESFEKWIKIKEGQGKAKTTIASYQYIARVHLLPFFGEKAVDQITPDDIQDYFNSVMKFSKSVSVQSKAILSGIFDRAVRMNDVNRNIMLYNYERSTKVGTKTVLQDEDLLRAISKAELLKDTGDFRDYLYFSFLCFTALRRGEILGLKWSDLDTQMLDINVRNSITFPDGQNEPVVGKPKNGSYGKVHYQSELYKRIEPYRSSGYVIPYSKDERLRPMTKSQFVKMWNRIDKTIDLKGATSHSFRASYATMLNAHCDHVDPKVIQGALRHKTPDLAIKVYTKENENKTKIAEKEYDEWLAEQVAKGT